MWDELSLPELYKRSLKEAVQDLPCFLYNYPANDEEVVSFTQNGGWQKIDYLLPVLYRSSTWFFNAFEFWIGPLCKFSDGLQVSRSSLCRGSL